MPLFVVATPIGNLDDITLRARETLRGADVVVAEDTRHSRTLLQHIGARAELRAFHEHSSEGEIRAIVALAADKRVAVVSDAGTPGISDPGYRLVRAARASDVAVVPVPGPSALTAFLSVAGLPSDRFVFLGFLPPRGQARASAIAEALERLETTVVYESPRRVEDLLERIGALAPTRAVVIGRELTKQFEEILAGTASEILDRLRANDSVRGEFVVGIHRDDRVRHSLDDAIPWIDRLLDEGVRTKSIARLLAERLGLSKSEVYELVLERSRTR